MVLVTAAQKHPPSWQARISISLASSQNLAQYGDTVADRPIRPTILVVML
jgi:hypothetical protein